MESMSIKALRYTEAVAQGSGSKPVGSRTFAPSYDHRSSPVENQGLGHRVDAAKDAYSDEEYAAMLSKAAQA